MSTVVLKEESYATIGACFEVYNEMGSGFLEPVYQECLGYELSDRGIPFLAQEKLQLMFKKRVLKTHYVPDFTCFGQIILEIKAVREFEDVHRAQVHNYLKATGYKLGLLVNFGAASDLKYERIVR